MGAAGSGGGAGGGAAWDVIYDGDCGICEATRGVGERLDWLGLFRWRPNSDPGVLADHPHLTREALDRAIHVVGRGRTLEGFEAARFLMLRWPLASLAGLFLHLPGMRRPGDLAYRWIADHRKTVLACRIGEPTVFHRFFASLFIVAVLALVAAGPVLRVEDWPLSCVPMFATPVEPDGARYSFRFAALDARGKATEIPADACGVPELRLERVLFGRYYGSVDPAYEYGAFPGDTPEAFEKRMTEFFGLFAAEAQARGKLPEGTVAMRLDVVRQVRGGRTERHECGSYTLREMRFRRRP